MSLNPNKFFIAAIVCLLVVGAFFGGFTLGQIYSYKKLGIQTNKLQQWQENTPTPRSIQRQSLPHETHL